MTALSRAWAWLKAHVSADPWRWGACALLAVLGWWALQNAGGLLVGLLAFVRGRQAPGLDVDVTEFTEAARNTRVTADAKERGDAVVRDLERDRERVDDLAPDDLARELEETRR